MLARLWCWLFHRAHWHPVRYDHGRQGWRCERCRENWYADNRR